jgi:excisionase family DNA binding protein
MGVTWGADMSSDVASRLEWLVRAAPDLVEEVFADAHRALLPQLAEMEAKLARLSPAVPEQFLKVSQVCERTGKCHRTVRGWIRDGSLRAVHWGRGREWRIRASDLEAFLTGGKQ